MGWPRSRENSGAKVWGRRGLRNGGAGQCEDKDGRRPCRPLLALALIFVGKPSHDPSKSDGL